MSETFISPILLNYSYLENLVAEAVLILELESIDKELRDKLKTSIFLNFNRYLTLELAMIPEAIQVGFLESLKELMEAEDEPRTIKLLTDLEILPETKEKFLEILEKIKEAQNK